MEENKEIKDIVEEVIVPKLRQQFMLGCETGWVVACKMIKGKAKDLTSAKAIKQMIDDMCKEAEDRLDKYTKDGEKVE